jgi:uridine kinase
VIETDSPARPLVIVVSGSSGAGKSSLVAALASALRSEGSSARTLHFDDFTDVPDLPGGDLLGWLGRGADPREWRTPAMERALRDLLGARDEPRPGRGAVLVEEPFGRSRPPFDVEADLSVHLRLPPQIALARRLLREFVPPRGSLDEAAVGRLHHHLARFVAEGDALYEAVETAALAGADLVLDARAEQGAVTRLALEAVRLRLEVRPGKGPGVGPV